jgi:hypothetical protein
MLCHLAPERFQGEDAAQYLYITTAVEPLHALENVLITDCVCISFRRNNRYTETEAGCPCLALNKYSKAQHYASSGAKPFMPCLLWREGATSLIELTAKFKVGIMFTIVVVLLQDVGKNCLKRLQAATRI